MKKKIIVKEISGTKSTNKFLKLTVLERNEFASFLQQDDILEVISDG